MNISNSNTVDYIARRLLADRFSIHGCELVALIGTGSETNNLAATRGWIAAQLETHNALDTHAVLALHDAFDDHLACLWANHHNGTVIAPERPACLPKMALTDTECHRLSDGIAFLLEDLQSRQCLDAAVAC